MTDSIYVGGADAIKFSLSPTSDRAARVRQMRQRLALADQATARLNASPQARAREDRTRRLERAQAGLPSEVKRADLGRTTTKAASMTISEFRALYRQKRK